MTDQMIPTKKPDDHRIGNWPLAFSIALGGLIVGVFLPMFLFLSAGALIWMAIVLIGARQYSDALLVIMDRESTERRLASSTAQLLRSVIDGANIPILATDEHGQIVHTNHQAREVLGAGEVMIGRRFDEIMTQQALHDLEARARNYEPGHARLSLPIAGEMRDFDVSADPVQISRGAVLTFRDITELSRAMTLKADFAANASHELRTPIASIKGAAETLQGPARNDERMSGRLIEMISSNAERLELLASDLLDLSRLEADDQPPSIERVHLSELITNILNEFASDADRRDLSLRPEIEHDLSEICTDSALLGLILRNLVQNAIKFAHEGTKVRIVVRRAPVAADRAAPIPLGLDLPTGIVVRVIDKGIGIPLSHQQRIFERFYQVDDARTGSGAQRGTGLGLAIVKHAAKRLGGTVTLESVYQTGTTVSVELPRCADLGPRSDG